MVGIANLLLTLEVTEPSTVGASTTATARSTTSSTVAEAAATTTSATTASAVTKATTTAASTTTTSTSTTVWARSSIIETDRASSNINTHHVVISILSILNGSEANVSETLWCTGLHISWQSDVGNGTVSTESLTKSVLVSLEGDVANEQSIRLWILGITELLSTLVGLLTWCGVVTGGGEVNIGLATINKSSLLSLESRCGISRVGELDVAETLGATRLSVADDTGTSDLSELLEFAVKPLIVNIPAQITNEQVLGTGISDLRGLFLGLLRGSWGLLLSLALLGWSLSLGCIGVIRVLLVIFTIIR